MCSIPKQMTPKRRYILTHKQNAQNKKTVKATPGDPDAAFTVILWNVSSPYDKGVISSLS